MNPGINKKQLKDLIARVIAEMGLYSEAAVNLLLGTAAQESRMGHYLRQIRGGALSAFQIEKPTFNYLKSEYGERFGAEYYTFEELEYNLKAAIIYARIKYFSIPKPLPEHDDIEGLAWYWKDYYNTSLGSGTAQEFIDNYRRYVA